MDIGLIGYALPFIIIVVIVLFVVDAGATLISHRMGQSRESSFNFDPLKVLIIAGITMFAIILWVFVRSAS